MGIIPNQENVNRKKQNGPPRNENCEKNDYEIKTEIDI
jgi:hypothetical protein